MMLLLLHRSVLDKVIQIWTWHLFKELLTFNQWVAGSNPARLTTFTLNINRLGGFALRASSPSGFAGSNTEAR